MGGIGALGRNARNSSWKMVIESMFTIFSQVPTAAVSPATPDWDIFLPMHRGSGGSK
jgi:hypothetical protein